MIRLHELSPSLFPKSLAGLCKRDQELMCEAYRRSWLKKKVTQDMMGLGMKTEYSKSKLFKIRGSQNPPRCACWWDLTEKGITILESMVEEVPYNGFI